MDEQLLRLCAGQHKGAERGQADGGDAKDERPAGKYFHGQAVRQGL